MTLLLAMMSVVLGVIGFLQGNERREIIFELDCVLGWLAGLCVIALVKSKKDIQYILFIMAFLGFLISAGVYGEVLLGIPFVSGATGKESIITRALVMRPTPSCWPLMSFSMVVLMAGLLGPRVSFSRKCVFGTLLAFELGAAILTLARTLLVVAFVALIGLVFGGSRRGKRIRANVAVAGALVLAYFLAVEVASRYSGEIFSNALGSRFSVFWDENARQNYANLELRPTQLRIFLTSYGPWLLRGSPLATPLWKINPEFDIWGFSDVSVVQLGMRYGVLGLLFLFVLAWRSMTALRAEFMPLRENWRLSALGPALCGLWVGGLAANFWSMTYTSFPVMALFFLRESEAFSRGSHKARLPNGYKERHVRNIHLRVMCGQTR